MRVLVAGGAGYIGSFVVRHLAIRGHEVAVLDNLRTGCAEAVRGVPLHEVDVRDGDRVHKVMRAFSPAAVIHLAALKSVSESLQDPGRYYDVNVNGTRVLLDTARACQVGRFVFSSSCAVYGTPQICPVDERAPTRPANPYGETKLACEKMVRWHADASGMRHASLRYFNVAGAALDGSLGEHLTGDASQLVPLVIQAARYGTEVTVFGCDYPTPDGTALRDFIHVEDLALAHVRVLEQLTSAEADGEYNLGTGRPTSVLDVLREVERHASVPVRRAVAARRPGDPSVSWADASLAAEMFGWSARYGLEDIVSSAWEWHRRCGGESRA